MTAIEKESCETCPLRHESCAKIFAAYIADTSKQARMQDVLNDFERYISQMFTADQRVEQHNHQR